MRWALLLLLTLHGVLHLMGFAKALGYADLPQLTQPISREWGLLWLLAGGLVVATAVMVAAGARAYWIAGALALLMSQLLIVSAWRDAWAGTLRRNIERHGSTMRLKSSGRFSRFLKLRSAYRQAMRWANTAFRRERLAG